MKNSLLILCLALFGMNGTAQTVQRANDWENPKVFAIHKEDPRVSFKVFADEQLALQNDYSQSPWYMVLATLRLSTCSLRLALTRMAYGRCRR